MKEFVDIAFSGANVVPTALLLFILLYWIIVIFGFIGTDFLDIDLDLDMDTDADADVSGSSSADVSWINNALIFFNLGKIPLMIWLSFLAFPLWFICLNVNALLGFENFFLGLLIFLPALIASLFIAKFLTWPFVKFFSKIDEDSKKKEIIGRVGIVTLSANHLSKGQAEINYNGTHLNFYITTREGTEVNKGDQILFVNTVGDTGVYLVEPYLTID